MLLHSFLPSRCACVPASLSGDLNVCTTLLHRLWACATSHVPPDSDARRHSTRSRGGSEQLQDLGTYHHIIISSQQRLLTCQSASSLQRDKVVFYLKGDDSKIVEIVDFLRAGKEMNNWGARVTRLDEITADEAARDPERARYQVTTSNVDDRQWDPNVEFYI